MVSAGTGPSAARKCLILLGLNTCVTQPRPAGKQPILFQSSAKTTDTGSVSTNKSQFVDTLSTNKAYHTFMSNLWKTWIVWCVVNCIIHEHEWNIYKYGLISTVQGKIGSMVSNQEFSNFHSELKLFCKLFLLINLKIKQFTSNNCFKSAPAFFLKNLQFF